MRSTYLPAECQSLPQRQPVGVPRAAGRLLHTPGWLGSAASRGRVRPLDSSRSCGPKPAAPGGPAGGRPSWHLGSSSAFRRLRPLHAQLSLPSSDSQSVSISCPSVHPLQARAALRILSPGTSLLPRLWDRERGGEGGTHARQDGLLNKKAFSFISRCLTGGPPEDLPDTMGEGTGQGGGTDSREDLVQTLALSRVVSSLSLSGWGLLVCVSQSCCNSDPTTLPLPRADLGEVRRSRSFLKTLSCHFPGITVIDTQIYSDLEYESHRPAVGHVLRHSAQMGARLQLTAGTPELCVPTPVQKINSF